MNELPSAPFPEQTLEVDSPGGEVDVVLSVPEDWEPPNGESRLTGLSGGPLCGPRRWPGDECFDAMHRRVRRERDP